MSDTIYEQIPPGSPFAEPKRPFAWVTWGIVGSTVAVFLFQLWEYHLEGYDVVGETLAFSGTALEQHRYSTIITYAWVHAVEMFGNPDLFWLHIVANMIPLIALGPALEELLGRWRFVGLYVGGAMASVLVWHFLNLDSNDPIIGASGAVFAVIAAVGTAEPHAKVTLFLLYILPVTMTMRTVALLACGAELVQAIFKVMPEVAHSAHLGGAAFGFLYVLACRRAVR